MTQSPIILQSCFADDFPIAVLTNVTNPTILMTEIREYYISLERKIYMSVVLYEYSGFEFHISMLAAPFMSAIGIIFFIRPDLFYKINNINTVDIDSQKNSKTDYAFFSRRLDIGGTYFFLNGVYVQLRYVQDCFRTV